MLLGGYFLVGKRCAVDRERLKRRLELERMMGVESLLKSCGVADKLKELEAEHVRNCGGCRLYEGATQTVFGDGSPQARLMFIGEAPGAEEDRQGIPFVGPAGKLLTKMIHAMGLRRRDVYITNIVKCRPPQNREPRPDEVESCMPFLQRQVELIQPEIICTLGAPAAKALLKVNKSMGQMRGEWSYYAKIPVLPTYHPAYLLRSPSRKKDVWQDLRQVVLALKEGPPRPTTLF